MKKRNNISLALTGIVFCAVLLLSVQSAQSATMTDYCMKPPFIVGGVTPNLLLMIDNSASMYDLGYVAGSASAVPTITCGGSVGTVQESLCYDNTYSNTFTYAGNFTGTQKYQYVLSPAVNNASPAASDYFQTVAAFPAGCIASNSTSYACLIRAGSSITGFYATGNFLNWLTASKLDIEKKILTGGKYSSGLLTSESRGCNGRRFVKIDPALNTALGSNAVTFSVRGPNALEPDFTNPSTQGGMTRVEIYLAVNSSLNDCQCAVANWTSGNFGQAQTLSSNCMNLASSGATGNELNGFTHSLQSCWTIKDNFSKGLPAFGSAGNTPNTTDLKGDCEQAYKYKCGSVSNPAGVVTCDNNTPSDATDDFPATDLPLKITSDISGTWICTGKLTGINPNTHATPAAPYDQLGSDNAGFLGSCSPVFGKQGASNLSVTWPAGDACVKREMLHYCFGAEVAEVSDPSATDVSSGNVPAVIMDASVRSLGTPAGTFYARAAILAGQCSVTTATSCGTSAECPSGESCGAKGLIDEFASQIRFGTMTFNVNGSASECGVSGSSITCEGYCSVTTSKPCITAANCPAAETCNQITKTDGARIISYIGRDPLGDHTTGMIKSIDDIQASSWTPFAEGFYNAIGYFARTNAYSVPTALNTGVSRTDFQLNTALGNSYSYDETKNPSDYLCQKNNLLLITDGMSTADSNTNVENFVAAYSSLTGGVTGYDSTNTCPVFSGSRSLDDLAWIAHNRNIKTLSKATASPTAPANASEFINTYVVYSGSPSTAPGECNPLTLLTQTAAKGGSSIYTAANPSLLEDALRRAFSNIAAKSASGTAASVLASGEGSGANLVQAVFYPSRKFGSTTIDWTGVMQNLWYFVDPKLGNSSIREDDSATVNVSDSVLKLSEDCVVQFHFDPTTNQTMANLYSDSSGSGVFGSCARGATATFDNIKYLWETGTLLFSRLASDRTIYTNLNADNTTHVRTPFNDTAANVTNIRPFLSLDAVYNNDTNAAAVINYVRGVDGGTIEGNATRNRTITIGAETKTWKLGDIINSTPRIMSWIPLNSYDKTYGDNTYGGGSGYIDSKTYKSRGVVFAGGNDGMLHAFEMGMLTIYNESDRKASLTAKRICSTTNINNYAGISPSWQCTVDADCPAGETCTATPISLGKEIWGFIPKHSLPYLKYLADPSYCHLNYIDATPYIFDVSMNRDASDAAVLADATCVDTYDGGSPPTNAYWNCKKTKKSWRTVLIGSMRTGGACGNSTSTCTECVKTPSTDPADATKSLGYSSYFALDVTDPYNPTILWEFSDPNLGFSTTGPAIVREGDKDKNGRWLAVFASGPTGYVSQGQMLGVTGHNYNPVGSGTLKLYVVDIKTGELIRTIDSNAIPATRELSAFAGSLLNSTFDVDSDYKDDVFYFGYTKRDETRVRSNNIQAATANSVTLDAVANGPVFTAANPSYKGMFIHASSHETKLITEYDGTTKVATVDSAWKTTPSAGSDYFIINGWTKGGVMRVITNQSTDPDNWRLSKVIDNIGPVTSAVSRLRNKNDGKVRLYFGSGRYFYRINDLIDDSGNLRKIYGIAEPCFTGTGLSPVTVATCGSNPPTIATIAESALGPAADASGSTDVDGWYIELDPATNVYGAERVMTDPLASTIGAVFFTTNSPSADVCSYGGVTHLWAVRYDTGGQVPAGILKGKAIIQLSTGSIEEINMADAFNNNGDVVTHRDNRRSIAFQGVPPTGQGLSIIVPPKPVDSILHIRKK